MKFIIKLFPEITIKSNSVRLRFIKILTRNIRNILNRYVKKSTVMYHWDYIEIITNNEMQHQLICDLLIQIPGIHHVLEVENFPFISLHDIFEKTLTHYRTRIEGKTFCVRVKRRGEHKFCSMEVERYIGSGLNQHVKSASVKLVNPDIIINLEIENNYFSLVKKRYNGIGGFPIGTQGDVLSLISGGFDSGVSSYMMIRRGCRVHYCLFNLGGIKHENLVRQIAYYLWERFSSSHHVHFVTINFELVIEEILKKIDNRQMGVILKRMMIRAASKLAKHHDIQALITGEVLGQVSSQTLANLRVIDNISDVLVLRPLISYDKEYIISLARKIGIENFANSIPEYCGLISKNPTIKAITATIEAEEMKFDFDILDKAVKEANDLDIRKIIQTTNSTEIDKIEIVSVLGINDVILDIRSIDEQDKKPLRIKGVQVVSMPFYELNTKFSKLDQSKIWLLWCERGIMSHLQALNLYKQGFTNVKIYRP